MRTFAIIISTTVLLGSQAHAYDLGHPNCAGEYGGLALHFHKNIQGFRDIEQKLKSIPWATKEYEIMEWEHRKTSLYNEIKMLFTRGEEAGSERYDIHVPIGSERFIAKYLADAGIINYATHAVGACGGADIVYMIIRKLDSGGDLFIPNYFSSMLFDYMSRYVNKGTINGDIFDGRLVVSPIEPRLPTKQFTVVVPSEVTRVSIKNKWDKFDVYFSLFVKRKDDYVIAIHTEKLREAPRTTSRTTPPSEEHFRPLSIDNYRAEYIAAASIARFFVKSERRCRVEAEGFSASDEGPFRCSAGPVF
jgi:hypothetical protein